MDEAALERVLTLVALIPPGEVAAYGEIGAIAGVGARRVGAILSRYGADLPWWRVTNASGDPPRHLRERAFEHWAREGIAVKPNGRGCAIARWGTAQHVLARRFAAHMRLESPQE